MRIASRLFGLSKSRSKISGGIVEFSDDLFLLLEKSGSSPEANPLKGYPVFPPVNSRRLPGSTDELSMAFRELFRIPG